MKSAKLLIPTSSQGTWLVSVFHSPRFSLLASSVSAQLRQRLPLGASDFEKLLRDVETRVPAAGQDWDGGFHGFFPVDLRWGRNMGGWSPRTKLSLGCDPSFCSMVRLTVYKPSVCNSCGITAQVVAFWNDVIIHNKSHPHNLKHPHSVVSVSPIKPWFTGGV